MTFRRSAPISPTTVAGYVACWLLAYAAWLTSLVSSASAGMRALTVAAAVLFPVGVVHGIGVWFGGW